MINCLSDYIHPCQALTEIFTIWEKLGKLKGLKLAYVGDGNNVAASLLFAAAKVGMDIAVASPEGYELGDDVVELGREFAAQSGSKVELVREPAAAVRGADVIYTDAWVSMGQEEETTRRLQDFVPYQVNDALVAQARSDAIVLHCLPAHRGQEITDEVADGPQSVLFDQAENRMHAQKAILALLMG